MEETEKREEMIIKEGEEGLTTKKNYEESESREEKSGRISMHGLLLKRGNNWPYSWVQREVVLDNTTLVYFANNSNTFIFYKNISARGFLFITRDTIVWTPEQRLFAECCDSFDVAFASFEAASPPKYIFSCASSNERENWRIQIERAVKLSKSQYAREISPFNHVIYDKRLNFLEDQILERLQCVEEKLLQHQTFHYQTPHSTSTMINVALSSGRNDGYSPSRDIREEEEEEEEEEYNNTHHVYYGHQKPLRSKVRHSHYYYPFHYRHDNDYDYHHLVSPFVPFGSAQRFRGSYSDSDVDKYICRDEYRKDTNFLPCLRPLPSNHRLGKLADLSYCSAVPSPSSSSVSSYDVLKASPRFERKYHNSSSFLLDDEEEEREKEEGMLKGLEKRRIEKKKKKRKRICQKTFSIRNQTSSSTSSKNGEDEDDEEEDLNFRFDHFNEFHQNSSDLMRNTKSINKKEDEIYSFGNSSCSTISFGVQPTTLLLTSSPLTSSVTPCVFSNRTSSSDIFSPPSFPIYSSSSLLPLPKPHENHFSFRHPCVDAFPSSSPISSPSSRSTAALNEDNNDDGDAIREEEKQTGDRSIESHYDSKFMPFEKEMLQIFDADERMTSGTTMTTTTTNQMNRRPTISIQSGVCTLNMDIPLRENTLEEVSSISSPFSTPESSPRISRCATENELPAMMKRQTIITTVEEEGKGEKIYKEAIDEEILESLQTSFPTKKIQEAAPMIGHEEWNEEGRERSRTTIFDDRWARSLQSNNNNNSGKSNKYSSDGVVVKEFQENQGSNRRSIFKDDFDTSKDSKTFSSLPPFSDNFLPSSVEAAQPSSLNVKADNTEDAANRITMGLEALAIRATPIVHRRQLRVNNSSSRSSYSNINISDDESRHYRAVQSQGDSSFRSSMRDGSYDWNNNNSNSINAMSRTRKQSSSHFPSFSSKERVKDYSSLITLEPEVAGSTHRSPRVEGDCLVSALDDVNGARADESGEEKRETIEDKEEYFSRTSSSFVQPLSPSLLGESSSSSSDHTSLQLPSHFFRYSDEESPWSLSSGFVGNTTTTHHETQFHTISTPTGKSTI